MDEETQPLSAVGKSFQAYLQRHSLTILEAARLARMPASLVWRMVHRLPISDAKARVLLACLATKTGARYEGAIVVTQRDGRMRARGPASG